MADPHPFEILPGDPGGPPADGLVRMAAVQMDLQFGVVDENLAATVRAVEIAHRHGARLVVFPECSLTGYCFTSVDEAREAAIPRDDPRLRELARAGESLGVFTVVGYMERLEKGVANSVSIVGEGGLRGHYQKTHLPHLGGDRFVTPGTNGFEVHEVLGLRLGLLVCYDASFPEASRLLAMNGADLILLPTNWPQEAEAKAAWLPNARAYENVTYYASVNRIGTERGFQFHGLSRICDPTGNTMVEGPRDRPAILLADIDPERARTKKIERREGYWVDRIAQRRPDLYTLTAMREQEED